MACPADGAVSTFLLWFWWSHVFPTFWLFWLWLEDRYLGIIHSHKSLQGIFWISLKSMRFSRDMLCLVIMCETLQKPTHWMFLNWQIFFDQGMNSLMGNAYCTSKILLNYTLASHHHSVDPLHNGWCLDVTGLPGRVTSSRLYQPGLNYADPLDLFAQWHSLFNSQNSQIPAYFTER